MIRLTLNKHLKQNSLKSLLMWKAYWSHQTKTLFIPLGINQGGYNVCYLHAAGDNNVSTAVSSGSSGCNSHIFWPSIPRSCIMHVLMRLAIIRLLCYYVAWEILICNDVCLLFIYLQTNNTNPKTVNETVGGYWYIYSNILDLRY